MAGDVTTSSTAGVSNPNPAEYSNILSQHSCLEDSSHPEDLENLDLVVYNGIVAKEQEQD